MLKKGAVTSYKFDVFWRFFAFFLGKEVLPFERWKKYIPVIFKRDTQRFSTLNLMYLKIKTKNCFYQKWPRTPRNFPLLYNISFLIGYEKQNTVKTTNFHWTFSQSVRQKVYKVTCVTNLLKNLKRCRKMCF